LKRDDLRPQPDTGEVLAGFVGRVTYHNAENGFCVLRARARGHRDDAAAISAGEWIMASGQWVNDRTHGQQFKARFPAGCCRVDLCGKGRSNPKFGRPSIFGDV
jgi:hypothetical protein